MPRSVVRIGDRTSHGGVVVTGDQTLNVFGQAAARKGDMTTCPKCKGSYPIVEGTRSTGSSQWLALEGMRTACGATLIASQHFGQEADATGASSTVPADAGSNAYRGRFQVFDDASREPLSGQRYRVTTIEGTPFEGETDAEGYTAWTEAQSPDMLTLELLARNREETP